MVVLDMFQMLFPAFKSKLTIRRSTCVYVKLSHGFVVVALEVEVSTFRLLPVLATYLLLVLVFQLVEPLTTCWTPLVSTQQIVFLVDRPNILRHQVVSLRFSFTHFLVSQKLDIVVEMFLITIQASVGQIDIPVLQVSPKMLLECILGIECPDASFALEMGRLVFEFKLREMVS